MLMLSCRITVPARRRMFHLQSTNNGGSSLPYVVPPPPFPHSPSHAVVFIVTDNPFLPSIFARLSLLSSSIVLSYIIHRVFSHPSKPRYTRNLQLVVRGFLVIYSPWNSAPFSPSPPLPPHPSHRHLSSACIFTGHVRFACSFFLLAQWTLCFLIFYIISLSSHQLSNIVTSLSFH